MTAALFVLASYLIGAVPVSLLAGKLTAGVDLRTRGSGNVGTTNALRVLGWRVALPVFVLDLLKGFIPAAFFVLWDGAPAGEWALAYGAAAILGHVLPVYLRFRGGKGVATGAGVFLALAPWAFGAALAAWALVVSTTRIVSLASLTAAAVLPVAVYVIRGAGAPFWFALMASVFVVYAHRSNIRRLIRGTENRFGDARAGQAR